MNTFEASTQVDAAAVGGDTVLARVASPRLEWVEVGGEIVAWEAVGEQLHLLDRIASLIFQLCDGVVTLDQTVDDLATIFGQPAAGIEGDVHGCAVQLCRDGLLRVTG